MSTENTFNISHYSDGMTRKYGNETNLKISRRSDKNTASYVLSMDDESAIGGFCLL